jgi:FtsH-binding integral membrane protein
VDVDFTQWVALAAGLAALLFGFKLLWLAVAVAGFGGALQLMPLFDVTADWSDTVRWAVAAVVGIVLALVTRTLTKAGMRVIGFVLAATFVTPMLEGLELASDLGEWGGLILAVIAGTIGAFVAGIAFKGAIIGLTAGWGATAIMSAGLEPWTADLDPIWYLGGLAVLILGGALYQYRSA